MLLITGQFKGTTYKSEPIAASLLAKEFGIPPAPVGNAVLEHRILPKKIKRNRADQQLIAPRSFSVPSTFTGTTENGDSFMLRYAEGPGRINDKGVTQYSPNHVTFAGTTMGFRTKDYDKFVYMYLHPFNASSPFKGVNPQIEWYDAKAVAIAAQVIANKHAEMNMAIWNTEKTSDQKIRMKAAGIMVRGQTISVSKNTPTATLRQQLASLFQKFPDDFIAAWNSEITLLNGLISDAIDTAVIEHVPNTGNGRSGWMWRKGASAGNVAVYTSPTDDSIRTLKTWASQPQNYDVIMQYLTRLMDAETASEVFGIDNGDPINLGNPVSPRSQWEEKTYQAIEAGVIAFDMATRQVRFVDDNGEFADVKPIVSDATIKDWVPKTMAFLKTKEAVWHKAEITRRLAPATAVA